MKIGILGTGHIGKTLVKELSAAGHNVKVANSRGPETIDAELLTNGAQAVTKEEALRDVEAIILSIPLNSIPGIAPLIAAVPEETVVIDTSNYYPHRDTKIEAIEAGQVESLWVSHRENALKRRSGKPWGGSGSGINLSSRQRRSWCEKLSSIANAADVVDQLLLLVLSTAQQHTENGPRGQQANRFTC